MVNQLINVRFTEKEEKIIKMAKMESEKQRLPLKY